jgi:hypothetical protein
MGILIPKPLIAFREWNVEDDRLAPRYQHAAGGFNPWSRPRGTVTAVCKREDRASLWRGTPEEHVAGDKGCTCGLYGYYEIPQAYQAPILDHEATETTPTNTVFGAYIAFGTVTRHRKGLRSEKARVVALRWSPVAEKIAALYEIPVCDTPAELKAAALKWGELVEPLPELPDVGSVPISSFCLPRAQRHWYTTSAGVPTIRATCFLALKPGVEIVSEEGPMELQKVRVRIKGLDDKLWTIRSTSERAERIEVQLVGSRQVEMKPGRRHVELELEAILPEPELDKALTELTKIGTIFKLERSAIPSPPGSSNHGW